MISSSSLTTVLLSRTVVKEEKFIISHPFLVQAWSQQHINSILKVQIWFICLSVNWFGHIFHYYDHIKLPIEPTQVAVNVKTHDVLAQGFCRRVSPFWPSPWRFCPSPALVDTVTLARGVVALSTPLEEPSQTVNSQPSLHSDHNLVCPLYYFYQ